MWNPLLDDPVTRLERQLSRLGARLGAIEHAISRLSDGDRARVQPVAHRIDDELWRLDLRLVSRGSDPALLEREMATAAAEVADLEREVERLTIDPRTGRPRGVADVVDLRSREPVRSVA